MNKIIKFFLCLSVLMCIFSFGKTYSDVLYYKRGSSPLDSGTPFAGETNYPEGKPFITHDGIKFWLYNDASGELDLNLTLVPKDKMITSPPVVSPDFNHILYTEVYNYGDANEVVSKCFYIPVIMPKPNDDGSKITLEDYLGSYNIRKSEQNRYEILSVGTSTFSRNAFRTLTIVDWSYNSKRAIIKEHVGRMSKGLLGTIIWIYDVEDDRIFRVDTVRKAIVNYWMETKALDLNLHVWDIEILGWEEHNQSRFVVNAYFYPSKDKKVFLGCWSADVRQNLTTLLSLEDEDWLVGRYGLIPEKY